MIFPFPPKENMDFKQTFLKEVSLLIQFDKIDPVKYKDQLNDWSKSIFNIPVFEEWSENEEGEQNETKVESVDKTQKFIFQDDSLCITLKVPEYQRFDNILSLWDKVSSFFNILKDLQNVRLKVAKANILSFQRPSLEKDAVVILRDVFTGDLLDYERPLTDKFNNGGDTTTWGTVVGFSDGEAKPKVDISYGFTFNPSDRLKGKVLLIIESSFYPQINNVDDWRNMFLILSDLTDRAFLWSINNQMLNALRGEK